jgi:hypothetical protein
MQANGGTARSRCELTLGNAPLSLRQATWLTVTTIFVDVDVTDFEFQI